MKYFVLKTIDKRGFIILGPGLAREDYYRNGRVRPYDMQEAAENAAKIAEIAHMTAMVESEDG